MPNTNLRIQLEAILFISSEPLPLSKLAATLEQPTEVVQKALNELNAHLIGGIRLAHVHDTYRLVTAPEAATAVRRHLEDTVRQELTKPALETLAIVAYRGPITKSAIELIRGVASETMLRNLMARGLVIEAGRSPEPGRPQLYAISHTFLEQFGLTSASDLPPLPEITDED